MLVENLLYTLINKGDIETLYKLKDKFFKQNDADYVLFVQDFYSQYNKLPDINTVESKFNISLIPNNEKPTYWYKEVIKKYQEYVIEQAIISSAKQKNNAVDIFQKALIDYNSELDVEIVDYSDAKRRIQSYNALKLNKGVSYLPTGNDEFDVFSSGYKRADLWTIGGYEGSGKTWMLLRMASWLDEYMMAQNIKKNILIVSGEMDALELEERLDSIKCGLNYGRLSKGELTTIEERKYKNYLGGFDSNIRIVDSFDNLKDIGHYINVYRPAITFIDGSHLLASSYDWTELAKITAGMKKMTRNSKTPIVNTTHLKADKGRSANGGNIDDFAYTKGYTRDSDIVGVMYASDEMVLQNRIGLDWVKVRRGTRTQIVFENDYTDSSIKVVSNVTGAQLSLTGSSAVGSNFNKASGQANGMYDDDED